MSRLDLYDDHLVVALRCGGSFGADRRGDLGHAFWFGQDRGAMFLRPFTTGAESHRAICEASAVVHDAMLDEYGDEDVI